ncbi:hypothetical protein IC575_013220 [Cucumis melo]
MRKKHTNFFKQNSLFLLSPFHFSLTHNDNNNKEKKKKKKTQLPIALFHFSLLPLMAEAAVPIPHRILSLSALDAVGKHRLLAEMKRLEQEARFLEEELEQLEKLDKASASCKELLGSVEMRSDPLLPETLGPVNPVWDQWFEGPKDSNRCHCRCRCWIL